MILNYLKILLRFIVSLGVIIGLGIVTFGGFFQLDWKLALVGLVLYIFSLVILT